MARGKTQSLVDTVSESEIVDLGEEINAPNIMIDDEFGIEGKYADYALVQRKISYRTGKEEDGINKGKVIKYIRWEDIRYSNTIFGCLKIYNKYVVLNKIKGLKKCTDFSEIINIYNETKDTIDKFLARYDIGEEQEESAKLIDNIMAMNKKIEKANEIFSMIDELEDIAKDKKRKHRLKLEE